MFDRKMNEWIKKEMVMSKISDQIQVKTCIHNKRSITYAFIGGLPIEYCYFVAIMLSTFTKHQIPHKDYFRINNILHTEWEDIVDLTFFRKKYRMQDLLREEDLYSRYKKDYPTKSVLPIFILKQELKVIQQRHKSKSPKSNSLDIIRIIVQDIEDVYESSNNELVIL